MSNVKHGVSSFITDFDSKDYLFRGLDKPLQVGHYHSWVLDNNERSDSVHFIAKSNELIMGLSHHKFDVKGLQFHPESILTPQGDKMIENWLNY